MKSLNELLLHFSQQKQNTQSRIYSLEHDCGKYCEILKEVEIEQMHLQRQIVSLFID